MQRIMQFAKEDGGATGTECELPTAATATLAPEAESSLRPQEEMQVAPLEQAPGTFLSIGILAGSSAEFDATALTSLFNQTLFSELSKRGLCCEIICVMGEERTQATATVEKVFQAQVNSHEHRDTFICHMIRNPERNRSAAWNAFVHASSEASSKFLFVIDGDVVIHNPDTLWNMFCTMGEKRDSVIVVDEPVKDIAFKPKRSLFDKLSLAVSHLALAGGKVIPEQLYVMRAEVARNIYLPNDLPMEGRFLATVLGTDYLLKEPNSHRIVRAVGAAHTYKAHRSLKEILQDRKRRMVNRTVTYVLVEGYLRHLSQQRKQDMGLLLMQNDETEPPWLSDLMETHIRRCHFFWQIFPNVTSIRLKRLQPLPEMEELRYVPIAYLEQFITLIGSWLAYHSMKRSLKQNHAVPLCLPNQQSRATAMH